VPAAGGTWAAVGLPGPGALAAAGAGLDVELPDRSVELVRTSAHDDMQLR
jgi:hypothetical protein